MKRENGGMGEMEPNRAKAALVTGAARRIGRAIALELANAGHPVALHCNRSRAEAEDLAATIRAKGGQAAVVVADLAVEREVAGLVSAAAAALGPLGVLVNNASVFERDDALSATRASWDLHMEVNLRAPFVLTQDFAAQVPEGMRGDVVNIIDQRVLNLTPHFISYSLSKAGLWTLTQTLALALAPRVRVNAIGPGPVLPSPRQTEEQFARQWKTLPLACPSSPEEIARALRFILDARSMTGQIITLDGGQHLGWAHCPGQGDPDE
jgi:NAD(P)-dependent dehydrogenase (short-subunit alcohol dehydrogenase family)